MNKFAPVLLAGLLAPLLAGAAGKPDFNGVWRVETPVVQLVTRDGKPPPLLPAAQKIHEQRMAQLRKGDRSFDATLQCKPMGEPRTAYDPEGGDFEILVNPAVVVFAHTWNRMIRFVYITKAAVDPIGPTYYGTANGQWQHGTLVVDAEDFHDTTLLDRSGLPHSEQLKLTERYRLLKGGAQLEEVLRFEDPETFSRPWEARVVYRRVPGAHIAEDVCIERLGIKEY
ncbi:MAG TPA: hypothetical protein VMI92_11790 [Steroidobacteraceae bacterium]|nr:hypothetical protein [Steroidobacteraceae bacterium]